MHKYVDSHNAKPNFGLFFSCEGNKFWGEKWKTKEKIHKKRISTFYIAHFLKKKKQTKQNRRIKAKQKMYFAFLPNVCEKKLLFYLIKLYFWYACL